MERYWFFLFGVCVLLITQFSCKKEDSVVCQSPTPIVERISAFTTDELCLFDNRILLLDATTTLAVEYIWSNGETSSTSLIDQPGTYSVVALDSNNDTLSMANLEIGKCPQSLFIPNSFSPNEDGVNDQWSPLGISLCTVKIQIRDLEGILVFESEGKNSSWDGKKQAGGKEEAAAGSYLYSVEVVFINGDEMNESGALELIR